MFPIDHLTQFLGRIHHTMSVLNTNTLVVCGGFYTTDTCISWSKDSPADNVWEFFALLRYLLQLIFVDSLFEVFVPLRLCRPTMESLATLVVLHFTPISQSVTRWAEFLTSVVSRLASLFSSLSLAAHQDGGLSVTPARTRY